LPSSLPELAAAESFGQAARFASFDSSISCTASMKYASIYYQMALRFQLREEQILETLRAQ
jgi:hypothetical protein